eukprot:91338_1
MLKMAIIILNTFSIYILVFLLVVINKLNQKNANLMECLLIHNLKRMNFWIEFVVINFAMKLVYILFCCKYKIIYVSFDYGLFYLKFKFKSLFFEFGDIVSSLSLHIQQITTNVSSVP